MHATFVGEDDVNVDVHVICHCWDIVGGLLLLTHACWYAVGLVQAAILMGDSIIKKNAIIETAILHLATAI